MPAFENTLFGGNNELTELNSMNRAIFLALSTKNHFSCDYLETFIPTWRDKLDFIYHRTNKTDIVGVDCFYKCDEPKTLSTTEKVTIISISRDMMNRDSNIIFEIRVLKYLFVVMIVMCCGYFVVKSKLIQRIRRYIVKNSLETTTDQQYTKESTHTSVIELTQREQLNVHE